MALRAPGQSWTVGSLCADQHIRGTDPRACAPSRFGEDRLRSGGSVHPAGAHRRQGAGLVDLALELDRLATDLAILDMGEGPAAQVDLGAVALPAVRAFDAHELDEGAAQCATRLENRLEAVQRVDYLVVETGELARQRVDAAMTAGSHEPTLPQSRHVSATFDARPGGNRARPDFSGDRVGVGPVDHEQSVAELPGAVDPPPAILVADRPRDDGARAAG